MIELTEPLLQALDAHPHEPLHVVDPRTQETYVLLLAEVYDSLREALEEDQRQRAIHAIALRNAAGRMDEHP